MMTPGPLASAPIAPGVPAQHLAVLRGELNDALRGKGAVVEMLLAALLARGHVLIEDLPGLGKTTLAKALARSVGGEYARVQCTPDLLPGDITGFNIFNQKSREFEFQRGPVFADILLVDEINRATPRTQSALLEAMAEQQVTVDNERHTLSECFFVIATQNPVEHHGTYPLPEAQLDRFAVKFGIGYPEADDELEMLARAAGGTELASPSPVVTLAELSTLQRCTARISVAPAVQQYLVRLAHATRQHAAVTLGLSPRGLLIWQRMAQAWALLHEREFVIPEDVQDVAMPVLGVRIGGEPRAVSTAIAEVMATVPVPGPPGHTWRPATPTVLRTQEPAPESCSPVVVAGSKAPGSTFRSA